ncbi:sciellin isoform X2 [Notolabrus celidotus]|uniref:sciellin isoform X2 n=1 Tax=Notolabrus celidotus TaxID=1203425 RepID=UPI001490381D|nr:sciellin isoform X2 [Notolabrus celidotus]
MALRTGLLKDGSWIKKADDEEEDIDRDPNFGKTILGKRNSGESNSSIQSEEINTTRSTTTSSVQALSKRFGGSSDDLVGSTTTTTVTKDGKTTETTITTSGGLRSPVIKSPTKTDTFTERVLKASSKGQQFSPLSPTKTTKVLETTVTTNKEAEDGLYDTLIPKSITDNFSPINSKTTVSTTETVLVKGSPGTDSEDKLFDTLIPSSVKNTYSPMDSETSVSSTETVTVRSSNNGDVKTTTTTRSSSSAEDDLYSTLLPKAITSGLSPSISSSSSSSITRREYITVESSRGLETQISSSPTSTRRTTSYSSYNDDIPSSRTTSYTINTKSSDIYDTDNKSYSYSKPDSSYNSISSPSSYSSTTYRSSSRSDDSLSDPIYSRSSTKNVYGSSERAVLEKDLCTYCHKPFTGDAKMVLDEMKINCHVTCFKCEVCNRTLEHLKAGDSMWVYKHMVHCENCFDSTRERWRL